MQNSERTTSRLVRALGLASVGLGIPMLWRTDDVARLVGVDDSPRALTITRAVGAREMAHAGLLLLGPQRSVWTRVIGDAMDLGVLGNALKERTGERRMHATVATVAVLGIAGLDLYTASRTRHQQHGKGRPGPLELHASVTVNKKPEEVYAFWRQLENLPTFMLHVKDVSEDGSGRTHWVVNAPVRRKVQWDAEITGDEPGGRISWKSLPGADVDNSGTVHFAPAPGERGTEVRVVLHYDVPGGRVGRVLAKVLGEEPEQQVRDDLRRFKQVMETGDVVRSDALPHGTDTRRQLVQRPARPTKDEKQRSHR
jgi:uncharacterized membrane protein